MKGFARAPQSLPDRVKRTEAKQRKGDAITITGMDRQARGRSVRGFVSLLRHLRVALYNEDDDVNVLVRLDWLGWVDGSALRPILPRQEEHRERGS